jgi:hypothetical protein
LIRQTFPLVFVFSSALFFLAGASFFVISMPLAVSGFPLLSFRVFPFCHFELSPFVISSASEKSLYFLVAWLDEI